MRRKLVMYDRRNEREGECAFGTHRDIALTRSLYKCVYLYVCLLYVQRCLASCQDDARDAIPPGVTDANDARVTKAQATLDSCVLTCADRVAALVPKTKQRIHEALREVQRQR